MNGAMPHHILLVDDDEVDRLAIRRALRACGMDIRVDEASDAAEALNTVSKGAPDCILLDYRLPGHDGIDILRSLRERSPDAPVVILTGHGDERTAVELMKAGASDYIAKSELTPERLLQSVRSAMKRQWLEKERERLLVRERDARQEAESANRAKDQFLAILSHELRTPLNAIMGWVRILRTKEIDSETAARGMEVIERNVRVQAKLIEDLLDVSRIISDKLHLDIRPVEPASVCTNALETVRLAAQAKDIRIEEVLDASAGPILGDPDRLQQVVTNLLTNAIKFTPAGGNVRLQLRGVDSGVEIEVTDSGCGISAEFLPRVFEAFAQARDVAKGANGGLGLGLTIVRNLVQMHGGTIRVCSEGESKGANFIVTLPFSSTQNDKDQGEGDEEQRTSAPPSDVSSSTLAGISVLFVDDSADARELLRTILTRSGAAVHTYASIDEALAALERMRPDVIISDIQMPGGDGYELIRALRVREDPKSRIPAIALTGFTTLQDRIHVLSAGFQLHVPKPVDSTELITAISSLVSRCIAP
jgi:signal transduction histidine kinase